MSLDEVLDAARASLENWKAHNGGLIASGALLPREIRALEDLIAAAEDSYAAGKAAGRVEMIEPDCELEYAVEYRSRYAPEKLRYNRVADAVAARNTEANYRFAGAFAIDPEARAVVRQGPSPWRTL